MIVLLEIRTNVRMILEALTGEDDDEEGDEEEAP
jgi:hypothetical protein